MTSLNLGNHFDTSNVTRMQNMFYWCGADRMTTLDLGNLFDTSKVANMECMFCGVGAQTIYAGQDFNTSNVTNCQYIFKDCQIVGGNGTHYNSTMESDASYARIDQGPSNPGLFTQRP